MMDKKLVLSIFAFVASCSGDGGGKNVKWPEVHKLEIERKLDMSRNGYELLVPITSPNGKVLYTLSCRSGNDAMQDVWYGATKFLLIADLSCVLQNDDAVKRGISYFSRSAEDKWYDNDGFFWIDDCRNSDKNNARYQRKREFKLRGINICLVVDVESKSKLGSIYIFVKNDEHADSEFSIHSNSSGNCTN